MKHFVAKSYFEVVADVNDTWAKVKGIGPDYKGEFGVTLFTRMFDFAPAVWKNFPWGHGVQVGEDLTANKDFVVFARKFITMLDLAIDMLGPDMDMVEEQLQQLGVQHIGYGVMPKHYPLMGKALTDTLEQKLGERFTRKHKDSWNTIYTFMSVSMMQGAFQHLTKPQNNNNPGIPRSASHQSLASIPNTKRRTSTSSTLDSSVTNASSSSFTVMDEGLAILVSFPLSGNDNGKKQEYEFNVLLQKNELFANPQDLTSLVDDWEDVIATAMTRRLQRKLRRTTNLARLEHAIAHLSLEGIVQGKRLPLDQPNDLIYCITQIQQQQQVKNAPENSSSNGGVLTLHLVYDTDDLELPDDWDGRNFDHVHVDDALVAVSETVDSRRRDSHSQIVNC